MKKIQDENGRYCIAVHKLTYQLQCSNVPWPALQRVRHESNINLHNACWDRRDGHLWTHSKRGSFGCNRNFPDHFLNEGSRFKIYVTILTWKSRYFHETPSAKYFLTPNWIFVFYRHWPFISIIYVYCRACGFAPRHPGKALNFIGKKKREKIYIYTDIEVASSFIERIIRATAKRI